MDIGKGSGWSHERRPPGLSVRGCEDASVPSKPRVVHGDDLLYRFLAELFADASGAYRRVPQLMFVSMGVWFPLDLYASRSGEHRSCLPTSGFRLRASRRSCTQTWSPRLGRATLANGRKRKTVGSRSNRSTGSPVGSSLPTSSRPVSGQRQQQSQA